MYQMRRKTQSRRTYFWSIIAIVILLGLAMYESRGNELKIKKAADIAFESLGAKETVNYPLQDIFFALDEWSEQLIDKEHIGAKWLLRWDMSIAHHKVEEMAQKLYVDERNMALNKVISQNGNYITGVIPSYNGKLTIQRVLDEAANEKVIAVLQLEHDPSDAKLLKKYVEYADKTIASFATNVSVSAKITGEMKEDALKKIGQVTHSTKVEEYKDNAMNVITAHTTKLKKSYWLTNDKMVNLQYAVYVDKNTKNSILTLAIPLISGEFGEVTAN